MDLVVLFFISEVVPPISEAECESYFSDFMLDIVAALLYGV